jgi:hypothetical protein
MKTIGAVVVVVAGIVLVGCDVGDTVDGKILVGIQEYFPNAEIGHVNNQSTRYRALVVNTHLDGVSEKFAAKTVQGILDEHKSEIEMGFGLAGYTHLTVWLGETACAWHVGDRKFGCAQRGQSTSREYLIHPPVPSNPFGQFGQ